MSPSVLSSSSSSSSVCWPGERNFHEPEKNLVVASSTFLFLLFLLSSFSFFYGYRSFVWPSVPKELTEGHEQSRNEPELEGDPLISWLAASTSIFHRSNNRCNVPLKIHLVIGAVLVLSFFFLSSFSFLFFFFLAQLKWLLRGCSYKWYRFYVRLYVCMVEKGIRTVPIVPGRCVRI